MRLTPDQLDWIVQEVVVRLRTPPRTGRSANQPPLSSCLQILDNPVIALKDLAGKLGGITQLTIARGALITPLAADELRRRGVAICREQLPTTCPTSGVDHNLALDPVGNSQTPEFVVSRVAGILRQHGRAVAFTGRPHALVCWLNRRPMHRATIIPSADCLPAAVEQIDPNILVIDARQFDVAAAKKINADWQALAADQNSLHQNPLHPTSTSKP